MALNPRQETFARLVALGTMGLAEAFVQAGYSSKNACSNALVLSRKHLVASRIEELRSTSSSNALSRADIVKLLSMLAQVGRSEMTQLKAAELLCKMQGYAEPERIAHSHQHIHVDASLMTQLREGYSALAGRTAAPSLIGGGGGVGDPQQEATLPTIKAVSPLPSGGPSEILHTSAEVFTQQP